MKTKVSVSHLLSVLFLLTTVRFLAAQEVSSLSKAEMIAVGNGSSAGPSSVATPAGSSSSVAFLDNRSDYGVEGSMYLTTDFIPGVLELYDGNIISDWSFRYNMLTRKMQFFNGNDTLALGNPSEVAGLSFGAYKFIYTAYNDMYGVQNGWLEVLCDGHCRLLLNREITHHYEDMSNSDPEDDIYVARYEYYISRGAGLAEYVILNRKKFVQCFGDQPGLKEFIEENKLRCREIGDIVKIVKYMNSVGM